MTVQECQVDVDVDEILHVILQERKKGVRIDRDGVFRVNLLRI